MKRERCLRVAVVGAGSIGAHRARLCSAAPGVELVGVLDRNPERAREVAARYGAPVWSERELAAESLDAAVISVPTEAHVEVGAPLLERGVALLVEKPIAASLAEADSLIAIARRTPALLQIGHTERFNPAVEVLRQVCKQPRFIEAHRLGSFQARSLDIDVILDLMIHDIDVVLNLVRSEVERIDAVAVQALTARLDIANARLMFANGAAANLTASRISVGKVRKLRIFEPHNYLSLDYTQQEVLHYTLSSSPGGGAPQIISRTLPVSRREPLAREMEAFFSAVCDGSAPIVDGAQGRRALEVSLEIGRCVAEAHERGRSSAERASPVEPRDPRQEPRAQRSSS
ncbi:MAG: Gfo/Idh/MocA family oxidoreductase [Acidobacteriota bacterium]